MSTPLHRVCLEMAVIAKRFTSCAKQGQKCDSKGVEQPEPVSTIGIAYTHGAHSHTKAQVFCITKTRLDTPTLGVVVDKSARGSIDQVSSKAPWFFHVSGVYADYGAYLVLMFSDLRAAQSPRASALAYPLSGWTSLALRIGDINVAAEANHKIKAELMFEKFIQLVIPEATIGDNQCAHPFRQDLL